MRSELSARHFHNKDAAFAFVEAKLWPHGPVCPHCGVIGSAGRLRGKSVRPGLQRKNPVFTSVERGGRGRSFHVPHVTASNLRPIIGRYVWRDTRFMTDESPIYTGIGWNLTEHGTVTHSKDAYVLGDIHTNTAEGYYSILKRGVYRHVSEAHPLRRLSELDFRYSCRVKLGIDDRQRADSALAGAEGKRLMYRTATGTWTAPSAA